MSQTPENVNSHQPALPSSCYSKSTGQRTGNQEGKYGHHRVKVAAGEKSHSEQTLTSPLQQTEKQNTRNDTRYPDLYVDTLATLALFADTLMEAGLYEEVTAVLTVLTNIIQEHNDAEEKKAENERIEVEEDRRRNEQYLRQKQAIEALYQRLLKQRAKLTLEEQEARFDDYLNRLETTWIKQTKPRS